MWSPRPLILAALASLAVSACGAGAAGSASGPSAPVDGGPVTPAPSAGAFSCPAQQLAGSPPSSRLTGVSVSPGDGYDRVTFTFGTSPADHPADAAGLIVKPYGAPPKTDASGRPLAVAGTAFLDVRFRDMVRTADDGSPAFTGPTELRPSSGAVADVIRLRDEDQVVDWLVAMTGPCVRVWTDGPTTLSVDVQRP